MTTPPTSEPTATPAPDSGAREWVSFVDDNGETWLFDLTFFRSNYHCIYGQGCSGIEAEPAPDANRGCCSYGAHFVDDEDLHRVMSVAATLPAELWDNSALFPQLGGPDTPIEEVIEALTEVDEDGDRITRIVDGACVLLNGNNAPTGPGCALHFAAVRAELEPLVWKPEVCWQVPIRVEHHLDDYDRHTHFVRQWTRGDWGDDSGIGWWCSEADEAYSSAQSAARTLRAEIAALAGDSVADALVRHVDGEGQVVRLPLPTRKNTQD